MKYYINHVNEKFLPGKNLPTKKHNHVYKQLLLQLLSLIPQNRASPAINVNGSNNHFNFTVTSILNSLHARAWRFHIFAYNVFAMLLSLHMNIVQPLPVHARTQHFTRMYLRCGYPGRALWSR